MMSPEGSSPVQFVTRILAVRSIRKCGSWRPVGVVDLPTREPAPHRVVCRNRHFKVVNKHVGG